MCKELGIAAGPDQELQGQLIARLAENGATLINLCKSGLNGAQCR